MNMDGSEQTHPNKAFKKTDTYEDQWVTFEGGNDLIYSTSTESISIGESSGSNGSLSSSDMVDDATSSSSSHGPLYELSEIMAQLPIKRGLSKYYQGKSQTFASLDCVKSLEDLAKKDRPYKKKIKSSKSYGGFNTRIVFRPEAIISKKTSRPCSFSSLGAWNWANCSAGQRSPGFGCAKLDRRT